MPTGNREVMDSPILDSKKYFVEKDNLKSLQWELCFSLLRRYNCFAGCKVCYIDEFFEKDKSKFTRFVPTEITNELRDEWVKIFGHYQAVSTIDDMFWLKHKHPVLFKWYQENAELFHFGTLTDNSFIRNFDIFKHEIVSDKRYPEITFSDGFLVKANIDDLIEKLNDIRGRHEIRIMKLIQSNPESMNHPSVVKLVAWARANAQEFTVQHDFTKYNTVNLGTKDQETVFATLDSKLYNICGEVDYFQYDSFFLTLEEATNITTTPYYTIEDGFDSQKHLAAHLKGKVKLYSDYAQRLRFSTDLTKRYANYFKWVSEHLIVNEDFNYVPIVSLKNCHNYYQAMLQDGWAETSMGLVRQPMTDIVPLFRFKP